MIGSYYEAHALDPIKSLGNVSPQASLAHEAIRNLLMGPVGQFAPWGEQTVSGWRPIAQPPYNYSIFPINAQTLTQAERQASGNPVGVIGALFSVPVPLRDVDAMFSEGPYEAFRGEAIYRLDDTKPVPTPQFLYFGKLMNEGAHDGTGSYRALDQSVTESGGTLVFVLPTDRVGTERGAPRVPLETAIAAELAAPNGPASLPQVPTNAAADPTVIPDGSAAPTDATKGDAYHFVVGSVGLVGGVFLGYYLAR